MKKLLIKPIYPDVKRRLQTCASLKNEDVAMVEMRGSRQCEERLNQASIRGVSVNYKTNMEQSEATRENVSHNAPVYPRCGHQFDIRGTTLRII